MILFCNFTNPFLLTNFTTESTLSLVFICIMHFLVFLDSLLEEQEDKYISKFPFDIFFFKVHWVKNASGTCTLLYITYMYNRLESVQHILFCFVVLNYVHRYLLRKCCPQSYFTCKLFIFKRHLFWMSCSKILKRYSNREYWVDRYLSEN